MDEIAEDEEDDIEKETEESEDEERILEDRLERPSLQDWWSGRRETCLRRTSMILNR